MELHQALRRVSAFAASGAKAPDLYKTVMLLGNDVPDLPGRVFATDGWHGCIIPVDRPLPTGLLGGRWAKLLAKHELAQVRRAGDTFHVETAEGNFYQLGVLDSMAYPLPPDDVLALQPYPYWPHVWPIVHAAASPKSKQPTFRYIHFRPTCVEATDAIRVAVADVPGLEPERLIPARLFAGWRDGEVRMGFTDKLIFVARGDELRFCPQVVENHFPDCKRHLPSEHAWPALVVETKALRNALIKAQVVSALQTVALHFDGADLKLKSWDLQDGTDPREFEARFRGTPAGVPEGLRATKVVNGRYLLDAVKAARTPHLRLCYQESVDSPLRIEHGATAESLWPWRT